MFLQLNHLIINKLPPIGASQDILGNDVCQVLSRQGYTKNDRDLIWLKWQAHFVIQSFPTTKKIFLKDFSCELASLHNITDVIMIFSILLLKG